MLAIKAKDLCAEISADCSISTFNIYTESVRSFVGIYVIILFEVALILFVSVQKSKKKKIKNYAGDERTRWD